jgi:N-acetylmuramoyl-L-alanine amidase
MFPAQYQYSTVYWTNGRKAEDIREAAPANKLDPWNAAFAHIMHKDVLDELRNPDRGEKLEHLGVLRPLPMPGVLVESGFLSNDEEARRVANPKYQDRIAQALAQGVLDYVALLDSIHGAVAQAREGPAAPKASVSAPAAPPGSGARSAPTRPQ